MQLLSSCETREREDLASKIRVTRLNCLECLLGFGFDHVRFKAVLIVLSVLIPSRDPKKDLANFEGDTLDVGLGNPAHDERVVPNWTFP
jgi:hypothetical protein